MLVLTRFPDQRVVITTPEGREIAVTVVEVRPGAGKVRLGFEADREVAIMREELVGRDPGGRAAR